MLQTRHIILPLFAVAALSFSSLTMANPVLATVNGKPITQQDFDRFLVENQLSVQEVERREVIEELVTRELVMQDAARKGLENRDDVKAAIEAARINVILGSALEEAVAKPPITDAQLRQVYQAEIAQLDLNEFRARHILVDSRQRAEQIITELDMGGNFAELARQHSADGSAQRGGDLGWFNLQQMVPEFSRAVASLEKGKYTKNPVQSQFGWHVIQLDDQRKGTPPPFESVRPQLMQIIERQRLQQYLEGLRERGRVSIN